MSDGMDKREYDANQGIVITNRDVYNLLTDYIEGDREWKVAHTASDSKSFTSLNIKVYGVLAGLVSVLVAIGAKIHL